MGYFPVEINTGRYEHAVAIEVDCARGVSQLNILEPQYGLICDHDPHLECTTIIECYWKELVR